MNGIIEPRDDVESFDELDLSPVMRRAIQKAGFEKPSPIQSSLIPLALAGMLFGTPRLVQVGMLAYLGALLLHFLTLPVEFNASRRAMKQLRRLGLEGKEEKAAKEMLRAAAMTYVASVAAAAWSSILRG